LSKNTLQSLTGRTIRAILFDFGNTLWTTADDAIWQSYQQASNQRAAAILCEHIAAKDLPTKNHKKLGNIVHKAVLERVKELKGEQPWYEPAPVPTTMEALGQLGIKIEPPVAAAVFEALRVRTPHSRVLFDDVLSTLPELQQRGFLLGVVTNRSWGDKIFLEDVQEMGLLQYFDPCHMAISADLGIRKPNPAIFLHTLKALDVAPEEAVMVGDALTADIIGAQALNIFAIWKPDPRLLMKARTALASHKPEADDKELLAYVLHEANRKRHQSAKQEVRPDLIIEHISDLLAIFKKAGEQ
jgi:FMN phosphatase YigB (HAD superfamily)